MYLWPSEKKTQTLASIIREHTKSFNFQVTGQRLLRFGCSRKAVNIHWHSAPNIFHLRAKTSHLPTFPAHIRRHPFHEITLRDIPADFINDIPVSKESHSQSLDLANQLQSPWSSNKLIFSGLQNKDPHTPRRPTKNDSLRLRKCFGLAHTPGDLHFGSTFEGEVRKGEKWFWSFQFSS